MCARPGIIGAALLCINAAGGEVAHVDVAVPPGAGSAYVLVVDAGRLPRGGRLVVSGPDGEVIGAVAPFPAEARETRASVPVPGALVVGAHLRLARQVVVAGGRSRPPVSDEVRALRLVREP